MSQSDLWFWSLSGLLALGLPLVFLYSRTSFWDQLEQQGHRWVPIYFLVFPIYQTGMVAMAIVRCHESWSGFQALVGVGTGLTYLCVTLTAVITFVSWRRRKSRL